VEISALWGALSGYGTQIDDPEWVSNALILCDRSGEEDSSRVDGLERAEKVTPPRDFLDEHRGQSFGAEFLVDAKEIDLGGLFLGSEKSASVRTPNLARHKISHPPCSQ
jgi:hypothetical protein